LGVAEPSAFPPPLKKVRAADDGELGGGSGISHANAAGETAGGSVLGGTALDGTALDGTALDGAALDGTALDGAALDGTGLDGKVGDASSADGPADDFAVSPGVRAAAAGEAGADTVRLKTSNAGESLASASGVSGFGSWPGSFCRVPRGDPILSAGRAGGASTAAASVTGVRVTSFALTSAGPPFAETSFVPSITVPLADAPLAARPPPAVRSDTVPSGDSVVAVPDLGASGLRGARLGGAAMMPVGRVSWSSSIRSSSVVLEVTIVGEAPPEPSGPFVRLSKPSSL
jgi:hypothetical protein